MRSCRSRSLINKLPTILEGERQIKRIKWRRKDVNAEEIPPDWARSVDMMDYMWSGSSDFQRATWPLTLNVSHFPYTDED